MRTASGVILIFVAIIFFFGSLGYLFGGAVVTGVSQLDSKALEQAIEEEGKKLSETVEQAIEEEGNELPEAVIDSSAQEEGKELIAKVLKELKNLLAAGTAMGSEAMVFGVFLLVSACILFAGAVFIFQGWKPGFIYVAGFLAILGPVIAYFITTGVVGGVVAGIVAAVRVFEVIGGVMAIISARLISKAAQTPIEGTEALKMRTASGVILIFVAIICFFGSLGYLLGGAVVTGVSQLDSKALEQAIEEEGKKLSETVEQAIEEEGNELPEAVIDSSAQEEGKELIAKVLKELKVLLAAGTAMGSEAMAFGVFLLVSAGILFAGAVFLFQGRKPGFIYVAGFLAILGPVIAYFITTGIVGGIVGGVVAGVRVFEVIGGVMAIISARLISKAAQTPTPATAGRIANKPQ
ncbi:MAG: hypothetical protein DRR08_16320 [Candidatus Parabeggiatoa sp. nov. 2]|nr:MAG: hypothetical protein DRR08_16320 [Gammaproteobacteria bacterium]